MAWRDIPSLLNDAFWRWWNANTFRLGAALAYYTVFALAPVVLISLAVAGLFVDEQSARSQLLQEIDNTVGRRVSEAIEAVMSYNRETGGDILATVIGIVVLFFAATSVFAELQSDLNTIWGIQRKDGAGWWRTVKDRLLSFTVVLGIGFLLLVSLVFSAMLAAVSGFVDPSAVPGGAWIWQALNWLVSFALVTALFALIYKLLPDAEIEWSDVWVGAAVTALLFAVGKFLIGAYFGRSAWISGYGAAGSLVVILVWVYYSSQIFLYGAEFTYVHAQRSGKPLVPKANAEAATDEARAREQNDGDPPGKNREAERRGRHQHSDGWPVVHRLQVYWEHLRASYWFLPALLSVLAAVLALVSVRLDEIVREKFIHQLGWVYARGPEGARAVLATIAGSMITVAGVVFSVTIVALSLASNQFGPRLLRNFMRDRGNQLVLGTFVATFVYCLLVLRTVRGLDDNEFVPHLSVTLAILLALASLCVLIYFIHHVAVSIQAPEVVANVAAEMHQALDVLFPEKLGDDPAENNGDATRHRLPNDFDVNAAPILAHQSGYVEAVDGDRLIDLAKDHDLLVRVDSRPGRFVMSGGILARAWPSCRLDDDIADEFRALFFIGPRQTPTQDAGYLINQLVEVAARALSPGFNDPFTALNCLDRIGDGLRHVARRKIPSPYRHDDQGNLRVVASPFSFADVADAALPTIAHFGRSTPAVLHRLIDVLAEVLPHTRRPEDRAALCRHALHAKKLAQSLPLEEDRLAIAEKCQALLAACDS